MDRELSAELDRLIGELRQGFEPFDYENPPTLEPGDSPVALVLVRDAYQKTPRYYLTVGKFAGEGWLHHDDLSWVGPLRFVVAYKWM